MATKTTIPAAVSPSTDTRRETVVAVYHTHVEAQKAIRDLKTAGFSDQQIGVAAKDHDGTDHQQTEGNKAGEGAAAGTAGGLGVGAIWGLGIVAGALPAIGPVIAGGALAAIVSSAAGTAVAGGLVGALVGLGIPEKEAKYYEDEFNRGRTVVTVKVEANRYHQARKLMDDSNAYDYDRRESQFASDPYADRRLDAECRPVPRNEPPRQI